MDRQLRSLKVKGDWISFKFIETRVTAGSAGDEPEEDNDKVRVPVFSCDSPYKPHKDLLDCLTKLKKHALAINEINDKPGDWSVTGIKITGDVFLKKSRVQFKLSKYVRSTDSYKDMPTGQVTMYPDAEEARPYKAADQMTEVLEDLAEELWSYATGEKKGADEEDYQLPLFPKQANMKLRKAS